MKIEILNKAMKDLSKIDKSQALKILKAIEHLSNYPDDTMAELLIKSFAIMSLLCIIVSIINKVILNNEVNFTPFSSTIYSLFFMMLFMHLNNKSTTSSIILYGLTFISTMISIWI